MCGTYYRDDESGSDSVESTLTADRSDALVPAGESIDYRAMSLSLYYAGDVPEGQDVNIVVQTPDDDVLTSVLYQISSTPLSTVDFAGGYGFTGLHYVYNDGAMLQFWCRAE